MPKKKSLEELLLQQKKIEEKAKQLQQLIQEERKEKTQHFQEKLVKAVTEWNASRGNAKVDEELLPDVFKSWTKAEQQKNN